MDKITCPVCSRLNDPQESRCWFCSAELHPSLPESGDDKGWLGGIQEDLKAGQSDLNVDITLDIGNATPEEQIPDWLARIRAREAAEREEQRIDEERKIGQKKSQGGIPDWLSSVGEGIDIPVQDEKSDSVVPGLIKPEYDLPAIGKLVNPPIEGESDWMESLTSWNPEITQENLSDNEEITFAAGQVVSEIPHVDSDSEDSSINPPEEPKEDILPSAGEMVSEESNKETETFPSDFLVELPVEEESIETIKSAIEEIASPPIFKETKDFEPQEVDESSFGNVPWQPTDTPLDEAVINPDFLQENKGALPTGDTQDVNFFPSEPIISGVGESQFDASAPFNPDDLPDWLNEKLPEELTQPPQKPMVVQPVVDNSLPKPETGKLPAWLEAQRPIEAVELASANLESSALEKTNESLSTLEGGVAGSLAFRVAGKPSDLGGGLKLTERQKTNAALLSSIIGNSDAPVDEKPETVQVKKNVLWRTLLAFVLITLILLGGTTLKDYGLQPALFPEEVVHTFDHINSLPVEKPVLIAADYEAALAGEIRFSSQPLIEHLMRRNLAITLISTNPVDTALLSSQIFTSIRAVPDYSFPDRVVDLGYLPGGAIAIQSLNGDFQAAVPMTAELTVTSAHPLLSSVRSLQDFGAVIVITDDSESARVWIEQIQPQITATPLLLITSAQAAPLVQPYYQSGQLSGLVSGMPGGLVYERIMETAGEATSNLASLQLVSIVMAGMILVGGFISLVKPVEFGSKG